jgi:hypothetical protein
MNRRILIIPLDSHVDPALLERTIEEAAGDDVTSFIEVLLPAVMPAALPISACPPRIVVRLNALRRAAAGTLRRRPARGRVEIALCRTIPTLLHSVEPVDMLILVGKAGWQVRRASRGVAPELIVVQTGRRSAVPRPSDPVPHPVAGVEA